MESFRFEPLGQVNLTYSDIQVIPGNSSHQFRIPIDVIGSWLDKDGANTAQVLATGRVWVDRPGPRWVGELGTQVITVRGYAVSHDLLLDVTDDQLIALERGRTDGDVRFQIDLQVTLLSAPDGVHPERQTQIAFRVTPSRWVEILDALGSEVAIVLRVPSPLSEPGFELVKDDATERAASLVQAAADLRDARAKLRNHQWRDAVGACRHVLDVISKLSSIPAYDRIPTARRRRSQDERWAAMFYATEGMIHAAHHGADEGIAPFTWNRPSAEAVVASTAALLRAYTAG
jgi:hypothetical protein